jgi:hypothetical protein
MLQSKSKEDKMKEKRLLSLIIILSGALIIAMPAMAGNQLGHFCWKLLDNFGNTSFLELAVTDESQGPESIFALHGIWRGKFTQAPPGVEPHSFNRACHGTVVNDPVEEFPEPDFFDFALTCENKLDEVRYGGLMAWHFHAKINPNPDNPPYPFLGGPFDYIIHRVGGLQIRGNMNLMNCPIPRIP